MILSAVFGLDMVAVKVSLGLGVEAVIGTFRIGVINTGIIVVTIGWVLCWLRRRW